MGRLVWIEMFPLDRLPKRRTVPRVGVPAHICQQPQAKSIIHMVHQKNRATPHIFFPGIPNHWSNGSHQSIIDKQNTEASLLRHTLPPQQHQCHSRNRAFASGIGLLAPRHFHQVTILVTTACGSKRKIVQRKSQSSYCCCTNFCKRDVGACHILLSGRSPIICILFSEMMNDGVCFLFVMCVNSGPLEGHVGERFLCYLDALTATGFSSLSLLSCIKIE
jgi:hypothetical protein